MNLFDLTQWLLAAERTGRKAGMSAVSRRSISRPDLSARPITLTLTRGETRIGATVADAAAEAARVYTNALRATSDLTEPQARTVWTRYRDAFLEGVIEALSVPQR